MRGSAVIFDVDGTLVDSERHGHRVAFNRAFEELGLPYVWDEDLYGELRTAVEATLQGEGLSKLDEQSPLGIAVGMQLVGARAATWDLWGVDIDETFADLRRAAVGGDDDMLLGGGLPPGP